jgi:DNA-binding SARP family transcriptional activator
VEIRLLGAVQAWRTGTRVLLGPRKQRFVLAVLALEINQLVMVDRLVDLTWPADPPRTARQAIRVSVSRLRAVLDPGALATEGSGYVLRGDPMRVDVHRFRALVVQARDSPDPARARLFRQALGLWSGPALADAAVPEVADRLTRGLVETRLTATEECLTAELRLGRHLEVLDELVDLVACHPHRQRLAAMLMLAQYRAGRAADALTTFRATRALLVRDLGLEPERSLLALHDAILRADHRLDLPRPDDLPGSLVGGGPGPLQIIQH